MFAYCDFSVFKFMYLRLNLFLFCDSSSYVVYVCVLLIIICWVYVGFCGGSFFVCIGLLYTLVFGERLPKLITYTMTPYIHRQIRAHSKIYPTHNRYIILNTCTT